MRGEVVRTAVGFDLDQPPPADLAAGLPDQELAEQVVRDLERVAVEEILAEDLALRRAVAARDVPPCRGKGWSPPA